MPLKRYSSVMRMRLAFSVAAHLEPEILVIDEVLAVGDAQFREKCLKKMNEVAFQGRTVLFVSHNTQAILSLCTRCILLEEGKLIVDGETNDVVKQYLSGSAQKASHSWEAPSDFDLDDVVKPHSFRLVNKKGELYESMVDDQSEIYAEIQFSLSKNVFGLLIVYDKF